MLNGVIQLPHSGAISGNRNADSIAAELEKYGFVVCPLRSIQTPGTNAGLLKAFGFGQVGGRALAAHPDYLLAVMSCEQLDEHKAKADKREKVAYRYWQDALVDNHMFV
ncbi:hypothetical protein GQ54DRAFT_306493 [Martensiomyces pterosporus]|nr:hypothetical protein GQ54DRAFT_306493 [Martensiomyces pterosporus]